MNDRLSISRIDFHNGLFLGISECKKSEKWILLLRNNWVVFIVYRGYPDRDEIKVASYLYFKVTKKHAREMAIKQLCLAQEWIIEAF